MRACSHNASMHVCWQGNLDKVGKGTSMFTIGGGTLLSMVNVESTDTVDAIAGFNTVLI